jgi:hypothetical protein
VNAMARTISVVLLFLLFPVVSQAQHHVMARSILDVILKENDFGYATARNTRSSYEQNSSGNVTEKIYKETKLPNIKGINNKIVLIDTFGFFTPQCSGRYGSIDIQVCNSLSACGVQKQDLNRLFWVGGIGTGKEEAFCVAITQQSSNSFCIYYLSILGHDIKVIKKKQGEL